MKHLSALGGTESFTYFLPIHGIGDRAIFLTLLSSYEIYNDVKARIIIGDDWDLDLYKILGEEVISRLVRVPNILIPKPLAASHWTICDSIPLPNGIFATWHRKSPAGIHWERLDSEIATHDMLVKCILRIPSACVPSLIFSKRKSLNGVCIAPDVNSNQYIEPRYWQALVRTLILNGVDVSVNLSPNSPYISQKLTDVVFPGCEIYKGGLSGVFDYLDGRLVVAQRSGLCDLLSLTNIPTIVINPPGMSRFWNLPNTNRNIVHFDMRKCNKDPVIFSNQVGGLITEGLTQ